MKKGILDEINRKSGMKVPDGYFDSLHDRVMQNLPEKEIIVEKPAPVTFWTMAKPWLYMAAMFVGIALMFKVFNWNSNELSNSQLQAKVETKEVESEEEAFEDFIYYNNVSDYTLYEFIAEGN